jgi:uncharacterized protein (TIGR02646 family)
MLEIEKQKEPTVLTTYRTQPDAQYDGPEFTPVKAQIRLSLLAEQGYLCAYCMQRINEKNMKVKHWACQTAHPDKQLSYRNLLACCKGNEGSSPRDQTCDTKKGDSPLTYSPANSSHKANRRSVIDTIRQQLAKKPGTRTKPDIAKLLNKVKQRNADNALKPYLGIMLHYLNRKC